MAILNGIIGILFIFAVAYLLSNNKKRIKWRTIIIGFLIQFIFAFAALKWSVGKYILSRISLGVQSVIDYAKEGISFIFGSSVWWHIGCRWTGNMPTARPLCWSDRRGVARALSVRVFCHPSCGLILSMGLIWEAGRMRKWR